jgi:hypothetical protein
VHNESSTLKSTFDMAGKVPRYAVRTPAVMVTDHSGQRPRPAGIEFLARRCRLADEKGLRQTCFRVRPYPADVKKTFRILPT